MKLKVPWPSYQVSWWWKNWGIGLISPGKICPGTWIVLIVEIQRVWVAVFHWVIRCFVLPFSDNGLKSVSGRWRGSGHNCPSVHVPGKGSTPWGRAPLVCQSLADLLHGFIEIRNLERAEFFLYRFRNNHFEHLYLLHREGHIALIVLLYVLVWFCMQSYGLVSRVSKKVIIYLFLRRKVPGIILLEKIFLFLQSWPCDCRRSLG